MGSVWLPFVEILRDVPRVVFEPGWETRSRSSGGFNSKPLGVSWHHTASGSQSDRDAVDFMIDGSSYSPVANLGIGSDGTIYVMAAGATNTSGSGRTLTMSRGTIPTDSANTHSVGMEIINAGTGGDPYPAAQIDAAFAASNAVNAWCGNDPSDVFTHNWYTLLDASNPNGSARKVDPARASDVQGAWRPAEVPNGAGTWEQQSVELEAIVRSDMPISDADAVKIAAAVWDVQMENKNNGKRYKASWFITQTHDNSLPSNVWGYRSNADAQTMGWYQQQLHKIVRKFLGPAGDPPDETMLERIDKNTRP